MAKPQIEHVAGQPNRFRLTTTAEPIVALDRIKPKYPGERTGAAYFVEIDGVRWADVYRTSRGSYGYVYSFRQLCGDGSIYGTIARPRKKASGTGRIEDEIVVRSQSERHRRREAIFGKKPADERTTEQVLIDTATELMAEGLLIDPKERERRDAEERERYRAHEEKREREEAAAYERKAAETLRQLQCYIGAPGEPPAADIERIVAVMKWAQTQ